MSRYTKKVPSFDCSKCFHTRIGEALSQFCQRWSIYDTTDERSIACSVCLTACGTGRRSISDTDRCFSSQRPHRCGAHPASYYSRYRRQSGPDVKLVIHFHLLERLKMRGAVLWPPIDYVVMMCCIIKHLGDSAFTYTVFLFGDSIAAKIIEDWCRPCYGSGCWSPASHRQSSGSIPGQSIGDIMCTDWRWDRIFSGCVYCPLSLSYHECSVRVCNRNCIILTVDCFVA